MNRSLVVFSLIVGGLLAREGASQDPPPPPRGQQRIQFAVSVETVTLDVVVVDKKGRFVPGLAAESFEILEDGIPQKVSFFTAQFTPVTTLLLLDSSSSIRSSPKEQGRSSLSAIQTAAYLFVQNLSEGDTARLGFFNKEVRFGSRFTSDIAEHLFMLRSMKAEGPTALYDAILASLRELEPVEGRKSLLLFTDGDDTGPGQGSQASMENVIERAKESQVTIYTVGFSGWRAQGSESVNVPFLTTLAESTGGRAFLPKKVDEVKKAFAEVQRDLHRHYRMAYVPTRGAANGADWRSIEVRLKGREGLVVRTRQGYFARGGPSE